MRDRFVHLASDLADMLRLGVLTFDGLRIVERDPRLDGPLAAVAAAMSRRRSDDPEVTATRATYRRFGIDPTKTRPSSEALLRRVRKGELLPRINALVDVGNWCSLEFQLPYGLHDLDRVEGAIELRRGRVGEAYAGIRKDIVHVEGRPVLVDAAGPFGNPTSDSARTMVTPATVRSLVVVYAPVGMAGARLERVLEVTAQRVTLYASGRETARTVVGGR